MHRKNRKNKGNGDKKEINNFQLALISACSIGVITFVQFQINKPEKVNAWAESSIVSSTEPTTQSGTYNNKMHTHTIHTDKSSYTPKTSPKITIHSEDIVEPRRFLPERQEEKSPAPIEADPPAREQEKIVASEEHPVDEVLGAVRDEVIVEAPEESVEASIEEMVDIPTTPIDTPTHSVNTSTSPVEETVVQAPAELPPEQRFQVEEPRNPHLTKSKGTFNGPSGKEFYYNLNMTNVVKVMRNLGFSEQEYPYWIDAYGIKRLGPYAMVAANLQTRPKGTILESSWGLSVVVDTGGFVKTWPDGLDLAVNW